MTKNAVSCCFIMLSESWRHAAAVQPQDAEVYRLVHALLNGRFSFRAESWHRADAPFVRELLLSSWDGRGLPISHGAALHRIFTKGLFPGLDQHLVFGALQKTAPQKGMAASLNILGSTLASRDFWRGLDERRGGHEPSAIIFEILEHEKTSIINHSLLRAARTKGYRFALDDFGNSPADGHKLAAYGPYLSFIKLDGAFVRAGLQGDPVFMLTVQKLRREHPGIALVAEHVQSAQEARRLFVMGITAVQGRSLPENALDAAPGQLQVNGIRQN